MSNEIPTAGMWGVIDTYSFPAVEITRVTEQCFYYRGGHYRGDRETRAYLSKLVCWATTREIAKLASQRLVSANAEAEHRKRAARVWFEGEKQRIKASAMSASGQDAEERLEAKPASAVAEGETP